MLAGDGRSTVLEVPLVVVLWEHTNFGGAKRIFVRDEPNLGDGWARDGNCQAGAKFNDRASAVEVHPGPDYDNWKARNNDEEPTVSLWSDANFGGSSLHLQAGAYPDLSVYDFNDVASSVQFHDAGTDTSNLKPPERSTDKIAPISVVARLHTAGFEHASEGHCGEADNVITLVESSPSIGGQYDEAFNDSVSWIEVLEGPNWTATSSLTVFKDADFTSDSKTYDAPFDARLDADDLNDAISSVKINE